MSADMGVIICISNKTCAQIDSVGGYGTGVSGGLRTGEGSAASAGGADEAGGVDAIDPGAGRASGENFPVALRLLPARHRHHLMAVYSFARTTDDIGDRAPPDRRSGLLDELEADVRRLYARDAGGGAFAVDGGSVGDTASAGNTASAGEGGSAAGPVGPPRSRVVSALGPTVAECGIPMQPFLDLIQANRQDQAVARYPTFTDLRGYCELSANPVGRIVLYVFGSFTERRAELSDSVCTALQLAEHWQDVAEDLRAGRIYLPAEDMDRYGCTEQDLAGASAAGAGP